MPSVFLPLADNSLILHLNLYITHFLLMKSIFACMLVLAPVIMSIEGCSCSRTDAAEAIETTTAENSDYFSHFDSMPDGGCIKMKINPIGGSLARVFNDSNHIHLAEAKAIGIDPIDGAAKAWKVKRNVKRIESCREYYVDNLTHSVPYLIPEAADLLKEIGKRFNDSLEARGGGDYRLKVTSVLRTEGAVKKLRRRNINATQESAHRYGTTFDISYAKFICDSVTVPRTQEDLKNLLGEVLKQIRDEEKCFIKYERKQGCFHITARKPKEHQS